MKTNKEIVNRTKKLLLSDKLHTPSNIEELIKNDTKKMLENYFEIVKDDIETKINLDDKDFYNININVKTKIVRAIGIFF